MSWAMRRRLIIFGIIAAVIALIVGGTYYSFVHKAPSCTDNKQNQGEEGIDCGGPCPYLCTADESEPSVRFVRPVSPVPGRTDVVAYIDNPNSRSAAKALPYTIELYDETNVLIARKQGTVDLPANSTAVVFVPNFFSGSETVAHAFLTFNEPAHFWYAYPNDTRIVPQVSDTRISDGPTPRITATASNPSAYSLKNVPFIVTVFDADGNAIAASQTVAPSIPPMGTAGLVFTWPAAFNGTVARVEILPVVPLP